MMQPPLQLSVSLEASRLFSWVPTQPLDSVGISKPSSLEPRGTAIGFRREEKKKRGTERADLRDCQVNLMSDWLLKNDLSTRGHLLLL
jgi:hypothetical protein